MKSGTKPLLQALEAFLERLERDQSLYPSRHPESAAEIPAWRRDYWRAGVDLLELIQAEDYRAAKRERRRRRRELVILTAALLSRPDDDRPVDCDHAALRYLRAIDELVTLEAGGHV